MSNRELTATEIKVRELAEKSNPYDKVCPNRHLWNEGFIRAIETYKAHQPEVTDEEIEIEMHYRGFVLAWDRMIGRTMAKWMRTRLIGK